MASLALNAVAGWSSLEGKINASGIGWCDDHVEWSGISLRCVTNIKTEKLPYETFQRTFGKSVSIILVQK
jgi:hypothetical protein